jgi:hypothetical protein
MSALDDCRQFLEDLIMGDFNEDQVVSAQIIGGLISLIPMVDQVMDARDVAGSLYRINKHGGLAKASLDQKIDLGFAAFGVVPEVGSAFKTVFKPLYKERKALKGAVNSGVAMIEGLLSKKKGGALRWVKALDWGGNTQAAILQANLVLESCIALLDYIAQGHWWCPDRLAQLARDVAPGIRQMRGQLAAPIREAAAQIKAFITELLGEHAAAVVLAVAGNAGMLPRSGQYGAAGGGRHGAGARDGGGSHARVAEQPRLNGRTTNGKIASVVQRTAFAAYEGLNYAAKGLMGEHIVDHHVIEQKGWGLDWHRHDMIGGPGKKAAGWQSEFKKLNDSEIPLYLCTPSAHVLTGGIDSLWRTNRARPHEYAVVEAKANMNPAAKLSTLLGEAKGGGGGSTGESGRAKKGSAAKSGTPGAIASAEKTGKVMQMSHTWIEDRISRDFSEYMIELLMGGGNYSRHVFLVSPIQAAEHVLVMEKILGEGLVARPAEAQRYAPEHSRHDVEKEFGEHDLDAAEADYKKNGKPKVARSQKKRKDK